MSATVTVTVVSLFLFASIQGFATDPVLLTTALVGENVTLHCILDNHRLNISQIEWTKTEFTEHKIIIYNPIFGTHSYRDNVTVEAVVDQGRRLRGAHLHLSGVQIENSGLYNCDLSTYPRGSIRMSNKLEIRGPTLETPLSNSTTDELWSRNGSLTESSHTTSLPSHTKTRSYTDTNTNVSWTSGLHTNLTNPTTELSDFTTAAMNHSLSLDDITSSSEEPDMPTTVLPVTQTVLDQSVNSSDDLSIKTGEATQGSTFSYPTHGPTTAPPPVQSESTYPSTNQSDTSPWNMSVWSTVGYTGHGSTPQTSSQADEERPLSPSVFPEENTQTAASTQSSDPNTTGVIKDDASDGPQRYAVLVILPIIALVILLGILYRRYQVQKMMDLPPPFKPPPPPLKYSSVRSEIPMTDILT
ncbi:T-cell surface protein tactile-like isoform X1 [Osmerus mordax]|uniref:T-cell surface protein tactile-like isoform X1 n=2 Tax=Osmerus mordax TaxID=8014 RepID=UPI00350F4AD9